MQTRPLRAKATLFVRKFREFDQISSSFILEVLTDLFVLREPNLFSPQAAMNRI